jgi:hypothetical protein
MWVSKRREWWQELEVLTDERLDQLAERFLELCIGAIAGLTFGQYLEWPEECERIAEKVLAGNGLQRSDVVRWPLLAAAGGAA